MLVTTPQLLPCLARRSVRVPNSFSSVRDELLHRANYGELTADEAEAEAKRQGLEPFKRVPDPTDFDPTSESLWTLPMAVAWIAYRTLQAVRENWPAYCAECRDWHWRRWRNGPGGDVHEGWSLDQRGFPTLPHLEMRSILERIDGDIDGLRPLMPVKEARETLWTALGDSLLPATGVSRLGGGRKVIPAVDWIALRPLDSDHRDELGRPPVMDYADPLVPSRAVRHLWRPRREDRTTLPPLMAPSGDGYMPLSCAAQWIATEGGVIDFDPHEEAIWRAAFDQLLGAIASEKVRVVGLRSGGRELVPGHLFAGCLVDYPYAEASIEMIMSENVYLRSYPYVDDQHWRNGFDDALVSRHKDSWKQLMVEKGDVRGIWPFDRPGAPRSGVPGRPTSSHLLFAEMARRSSQGLLESSLAAESRFLSSWLSEHHKEMPQAKPKAVQEAIRARYWELRSQK